MGAFDHLEWTYNGAFEQLFGLGRGEFKQKFSKNSNAWGLPGEGCLSFDLTGTLSQGGRGRDGLLRDRVGALIINKNLKSNYLTLGIRFQFKFPTLGKVLSSKIKPPGPGC